MGGMSSGRRLWAVLSLAMAFLSGAALGSTRPQVLVLASYHVGLAWTDGQTEGLRRGLATAGVAPELFVEYLDSKRVAPTPKMLAAFHSHLAARHGERRFAAIVAQDDDALDFALSERRPGGLFDKLPIIFSGVAGKRQSTLETLPAITGFFDDADIAANVSLLRKLRPNLSRVVFVHDHSRTGVAQADFVRTLAPQFPELSFEFLSNQPVRDIQARLAALDPGSGVILLTFNIDSEGRVLTHEEASRLWAEASSVPVLVKEDSMIVPGVVGGLVVASRRQGELAAGALVRVLRGEDARQIQMSGGPTDPIFNDAQLRRFGIDAELLPANGVILGRQESLYRSHPREFMLLLGLLATLLLLALMTAVLLVRARRQRAQAAESERSYRELINATSEAIFIHGPDGGLLDVNDRFCAMYGYARTELHKLTLSDLSENVAPYAAEDAWQWLLRALNDGPQLFEWHARRANGELFWVEVALRRAELRGQLRLVAAVRDISQRKAADAALRASEQRYALILQRTPVGIVYFDVNAQITFCNDRFAALTGARASQIVGLNFRELRDQRPMPALGEALAGRQGDYEGPYRTTLSNEEIWVDVRTAPMFDDQGVVVGGIVMARVGENALNVIHNVKARMAELKAALPEGLSIVPVYDRSDLIHRAIENL